RHRGPLNQRTEDRRQRTEINAPAAPPDVLSSVCPLSSVLFAEARAMLIGLDLNATRARAVCGPTAQAASPLSLEGSDFELPVAVSLEERTPVVGRAGAALSRRQPDLACLDFLPQLGTGRVWSAGRLRIDAAGALALVFD